MRNAAPQKLGATMEPLDDPVDHVRGPSAGRLIVEYGDYECRTRGKRFERSSASSYN